MGYRAKAEHGLADWAWQEVSPLDFCTGCGRLDLDGTFVKTAPAGRTYRGDGIPEDGYAVTYRAALVDSVWCGECAR